MRYAIFADVHNDAQALASVLSHAEQRQIDAYFCLGDVGLDDCVQLVRRRQATTVFGNWEVSGWRYLSPENQQWALNLPPLVRQAHFWLAHAAPLWPASLNTLATLTNQRHLTSTSKLFPYLHFESEALWQTFTVLSQAKVPLLFHGHTHRQIVWRFTPDNYLHRLTHRTITLRPGDTLVVGVGSVGRPEDGPGAAFAIYDDGTQEIELVRISGKE